MYSKPNTSKIHSTLNTSKNVFEAQQQNVFKTQHERKCILSSTAKCVQNSTRAKMYSKLNS